MNILRHRVAIVCIVLLCAVNLYAKSTELIECIDSPTAGIYDYGAYDINFRLFSGGSMLSRMNFGVFKIVNLGFGWELQQLTGNQNITVAPPTLNLKLRPYPGGIILPALAIGYDGQGYYFNADSNEFGQKARGVYVVLTRELLIPGFELSTGANMNDFKSDVVYGFANLNINLENVFVIMAEYDNIHYGPENRLNGGFRFALTDDLSIDLAGRDLTGTGPLAKERLIRIYYTGRF
jgi:hypothetical protein